MLLDYSKKFFVGFSLVCFCGLGVAQTITPGSNYPTPPTDEKLLFYIQRSHNKNTIAYELNYMNDGSLNIKNPIHPYWILYEEGGGLEELSYIQQKFAYGLNFKVLDSSKLTQSVSFVCYDKKSLLLKKSESDNKYYAYLSLNDKVLQVKKIFIKTDGGTFWFPVVNYIEVTGIELASGKAVSERIIP